LANYYLLLTAHSTGRYDRFFCNDFLRECLTLIFKSVDLYEQGYFDCAFYFLRQSEELLNAMVLLCEDNNKINEWQAKKRFPMTKEIIDKLLKISDNYKQIENKISNFFLSLKATREKANKIIHKQGYDNFYIGRILFGGDRKSERNFFSCYFKQTIALLLIMYIVVDPLCLALIDDGIMAKIHFDPITDALDEELISKCLGSDNLKLIKECDFYKNFRNNFENNEKMNDYTFMVVREHHFSMENLDEIEKQKHLLNLPEKQMLAILQKEIKICVFIGFEGLMQYFTSIKGKNAKCGWSSAEYRPYFISIHKYNMSYENVYLSRVKLADDEYLLEHDEVLTQKEINFIESVCI